MVVIDTSILIDYLRRPHENSPFKEFTRLNQEERLAISILTIQELYAGKSSKEVKKESFFLDIVSKMEVLPYSYQTAQLAGEITRDYNKNFEFPDAAIAATVILNKANLFTLNKKDFKGIKGLKLI